MRMYTSYSVKIKHYNHIFKDSISVYRKAVDFLINVCLNEWDNISAIEGSLYQQQYVERCIHVTKDNPDPIYDFDTRFYKLPCYLRRSAINEAIGKVSSYKSALANWEKEDIQTRGKQPSSPKTGYVYPCMYKTDMYRQTGTYEAMIKVYIRNTWDWITVELRKSDVDYINRRCGSRKKCAPTLQKRGHEWFLDFPFEERVKLTKISQAGKPTVLTVG